MELWFFIGMIFLIIEIMSFGLISIWFAFGAFITMFFTHLDVIHQFYIFVGTSALLLILIRKIAVKMLKNKSNGTNRIIGTTVTILEKNKFNTYTVYADGKYWKALCNNTLDINDEARVESIVGNKLILKSIKIYKEV